MVLKDGCLNRALVTLRVLRHTLNCSATQHDQKLAYRQRSCTLDKAKYDVLVDEQSSVPNAAQRDAFHWKASPLVMSKRRCWLTQALGLWETEVT